MLVSARDGHQRRHGPHRGPLELVLLLVLLLHGVGLDLGGAGQLQRLNQLVQLLKNCTGAQLAYSEAESSLTLKLIFLIYECSS